MYIYFFLIQNFNFNRKVLFTAKGAKIFLVLFLIAKSAKFFVLTAKVAKVFCVPQAKG